MKRTTIFLVLLLLLVGQLLQAQNISGRVVDAQRGVPVKATTVVLMLQRDSTVLHQVVADTVGAFVIANSTKDSLLLSINAIGYQPYTLFLPAPVADLDLGNLPMMVEGKELANVTIVGQAPPVSQKGDTTQYSASQYKVNVDATTEDLIRKMPGITVDKNGTVTAQGEQVKKVTVDGRDFFGDDATAALRNLPAEVIDKIQVFDRLSDQAQFTGFDDGNATKAINIVTKTASRTGQFGRVYAGYGTDDRYAAGGNVSFFKNDRRISLVGLFNNINQQNFGSEDLLGVTSNQGNGNRGGNRNRGGGSGNNANNFLVGQQNGISTTNAFGVNYSDKWAKQIDVTGSYFFNNSNNTNNQQSRNEYFIKNAPNQFYSEDAVAQSNNFNHRFNLRVEYKLDSSNSIIFTPSLSLQKNDGSNLVDGQRYRTIADVISASNYDRSTKTAGYNSNNNLLYRHAFAKRGRTISVNLGLAINHRDGDIYLSSINRVVLPADIDSIQQYTDQLVNGTTWSANLAFTEPMGKKGQLQFNYAPSITNSKSNQQVFQFDSTSDKYSLFDTRLSNQFDNTTNSQTAGVTYRLGDRENMFSAGLSYKYTSLESQQQFPQQIRVQKAFNNLLPNLSWRRKFNARNSINFFIRSNTSTPSVNQLQNVINNNNPLFLTAGNPDLQQQITNTISGRYTYTNTAKGKSFFANIYVQQTNDFIANAIFIANSDSVLTNNVILQKGAQLTKPVNLDGYVSARSLVTYGMPVKPIKSNINVNAGFTWSRIPGAVNYSNTITSNYSYSAGVVVSSNINEYIDFNVSYNTNFNVAVNSTQPLLNNNYRVQTAGIQLNLVSKKGWLLQNDVNHSAYSGLSAGFNQRIWLWNAAIGKKFLASQAGELKLSVFDLLKQNQSIARTVTESGIEDEQHQVITRYFMLTFSYRLKNFGVAKKRSNNAPAAERRRNRGQESGSF